MTPKLLNINKIFNKVLLWIVALCFNVNVIYGFDVDASYAVLMDYDTGAVMYNKRGSEPSMPSSMAKIMTAYIAFERLKEGTLSLTDKFKVSTKAWSKQGSKMFSCTWRKCHCRKIIARYHCTIR